MSIRSLNIALCFVLLFAGMACADINAVIEDLDVSASVDIGAFKAELGARFGASDSQVEVVVHSVERPGDAAIVFWLGEQTRKPLSAVLDVYRKQKNNGWGAIAKSLGIKPGSPAFHALKKGNIQISLDNGKSKGKGKNKKNRHS